MGSGKTPSPRPSPFSAYCQSCQGWYPSHSFPTNRHVSRWYRLRRRNSSFSRWRCRWKSRLAWWCPWSLFSTRSTFYPSLIRAPESWKVGVWWLKSLQIHARCIWVFVAWPFFHPSFSSLRRRRFFVPTTSSWKQDYHSLTHTSTSHCTSTMVQLHTGTCVFASGRR